MRTFLLRACVVGALLLTVAPGPADAATNVAGSGSFAGSGVVSGTIVNPPATVTSATAVTGQLAGALTVNGTNVVILTSTCSFQGTTTDNIATGNGTMAGNCSGFAMVTPPGTAAFFSLNCILDYTRAGTAVAVSLACTGSVYVTATSFCGNGLMQWVPTDDNHFTLAGQLVFRPAEVGCL